MSSHTEWLAALGSCAAAVTILALARNKPSSVCQPCTDSGTRLRHPTQGGCAELSALVSSHRERCSCSATIIEVDASPPRVISSAPRIGHSKDPEATQKRKGYIEWHDYFMSVAVLSSFRSKDPNRQVGRSALALALGLRNWDWGWDGFGKKIVWAVTRSAVAERPVREPVQLYKNVV